ncbi:YdcF family protein [Vibrio kyushuensis]|uniref:YdcF family protein n=1 Tax=Vibrio kyushuensis TaxID=2910249 RepID=UPI003D127B97
MGIEKVIIVLGKRLQNSQLTLEGKSRVDALIDYLPSQSPSHTALLFCGGTTKGQSISESQAMFGYFQMHAGSIEFPTLHILLEQDSTSTVENIQHGSKALLDSGLIKNDAQLEVVFVSNDYHLYRIFEIQQLMDEQGLLGVLRAKCLAQGVTLNISYRLDDHVSVPIPYNDVKADLFLHVEALTTYRVYLEGVVSGVFRRDLTEVRKQPLKIAEQALIALNQQLTGNDEFMMLALLVQTLEKAVFETMPNMPIKKVREYLAVLDTNLTLLNRYLDPESQLETRWWR